MTDKKSSARIEWIDLAKGFCIMLVVLCHTAEVTKTGFPLAIQAMSFRMPLYFILSGLFFKQYEGFVGFLKRKTNKLLIPFSFFYIFTAILPTLLFFNGTWREALELYPIPINAPLWFLLCLFWVNLLFYALQLAAQRVTDKYLVPVLFIVAIICGYTGLTLGWTKVRLPLYTDTTLTALPFFVFGWWLFRRTNFLREPTRWKRDALLTVICALIVLFAATRFGWYLNRFKLVRNFWTLYPAGIAGTMMVLMVSKAIKRLPLVSYWGRYSIIILCVHMPVMKILNYFIDGRIAGRWLLLVVFVVAMGISHLFIPLCRRFLPWFTAQKDLIKINN